MGVLAGCDARRRARRMAIPCKRPATQQRARQRSQNVLVIHLQVLSAHHLSLDDFQRVAHGFLGRCINAFGQHFRGLQSVFR